MSILLKKLRKCSITFLISPNQEMDGNMSTLFDIWNSIQTQLFPSFEQEFDPLTDKEREFIQIVSFFPTGGFLRKIIGGILADGTKTENNDGRASD